MAIMPSPELQSPLGVEVVKQCEKDCPTQKIADLSATIGTHVLLQAIEKAQSFDPDEILKVLRTAEFPSFQKVPLRAGGEKTYGIKNHMTCSVPYSVVVGKNQVKYLGSYQELTP